MQVQTSLKAGKSFKLMLNRCKRLHKGVFAPPYAGIIPAI